MSIFDFFRKKSPVEVIKNSQNITKIENEHQKGNVCTKTVPLSLDVISSLKKRFIAIDFETTGLSAYTDRIIEIGAVVFDNGIITSKFGTLVKPDISIPQSATKINHITNAMVESAPKERTAINDLVSFISDAINGSCFLCAYNANFDSNFLAEALRRNGYDASLQFIDALNCARKTVFGLDNYKQDTVAQYFGIANNSSHRAVYDAEVCGTIMINLYDFAEEELKKQQKARKREIEISTLTDEQKEWCAYIQKQIVLQGLNTDYLCFQRRSGNYLDCSYIYSFLRIKFGKGKKYVIAQKASFKKSDFNTEPCVTSEGTDEYIRVLFNSPFDLDLFMPYIIKKYVEIQKNVQQNIREGYLKEKNIPAYMEFSTILNNDELDDIIISSEKRIKVEQAALIANQIAKEKAEEEKRIKREQRELEKQIKAMKPKISRTRAIMKLDDNGIVLEEFTSIAEAVEKTGVNSKSIRDAANGVQKHAGGFCWKYKE